MSGSQRHTTVYITKAAFIAALYVVLTELSAQFGLSGTNVIQFRISEALTILPFFTSAAIPGLAIGCFLSNLLTGAAAWDVVFGTAATLDGMIDRIEEEYGEECVIVATGRYSSLVTPLCKRKIICDKELILKGLIEVYYKNC